MNSLSSDIRLILFPILAILSYFFLDENNTNIAISFIIILVTMYIFKFALYQLKFYFSGDNEKTLTEGVKPECYVMITILLYFSVLSLCYSKYFLCIFFLSLTCSLFPFMKEKLYWSPLKEYSLSQI